MLKIKIILDKRRFENHPMLVDKLGKALKNAGYTNEQGFQEHVKKDQAAPGFTDVLIEVVDSAPDIPPFLKESAVLVTEALWFLRSYNAEQMQPYEQTVLIYDPGALLGDLRSKKAANLHTIPWSDNLDHNIKKILEGIENSIAKRFASSDGHLVVIDDEPRELLSIQACLDAMGFLEHGSYNIRHFHYREHSDAEKVLSTLNSLVEFEKPVVVISDIHMASSFVEGIELVGKIFDQLKIIPVVLLSQYGEGELGATAGNKLRELETKAGNLFHAVPKDFLNPEEINNQNRAISELKRKLVNVFLNKTRFQLDRIIHNLPRQIDWMEAVKFQTQQNIQTGSAKKIIAVSPGMEEIIKRTQKYANEDEAPVLLLGKTGTGKDLTAEAIHYTGPRKEKPFKKIDITKLSSDLIEGELFGKMPGSYTGAPETETEGYFEKADDGTLFINEIGDLDIKCQNKLRSAIEDKVINKVGSTKDITIEARIICATNKNLWDEVKAGKFKDDLHRRINVLPLTLPPLRLHKEDIPYLISYFLQDTPKITAISDAALRLFFAYNYPENTGQLWSLVRWLSAGPQESVLVGSYVYEAFAQHLGWVDEPIMNDDWVLNAEEIKDLGKQEEPTKVYEFVLHPSSSEADGLEAEQAAQYRQDIDSQRLITEYQQKFKEAIDQFDLLLEKIHEAKAKVDITKASFMDKASAIINAFNNAEDQRQNEIETDIRKHFVDKQSGLSILYHISERFKLSLPERPGTTMPDEVKYAIVELWDWIYESRTETYFDSLPKTSKQPWFFIILGRAHRTLERYKKENSE